MSDLYARQPSWTDYLPAEWQSAINTSPVINALSGYINRRPADIEGASNKIFGQPGDREEQDRNWLLQQARGPSALERMNPVAQDGVNKLGLLANFFGPGAKLPPAAPKPTGIRAYHGSPHDFDKFDISKIGTGEGAQAYGRGLYFAESEGVARSYRNTLGTWGNEVKRRATDELGINLSDFGATEFQRAAMAAKDDPIRAAKLIQWRVPETRTLPLEKIASVAKQLHGIDRPGRMYEVNIKADPDQFLDWDKPLSQQPEGVRKAWGTYARSPEAAELAKNYYSYKPGQTLADLKEFADPYGSTIARNLPGGKEAPNFLRDAGIPGIKYLDQGSRVAGQGSRNYVVFDDKLVEILRKYGLLPPVAAGTAAALNQQEPPL